MKEKHSYTVPNIESKFPTSYKLLPLLYQITQKVVNGYL